MNYTEQDIKIMDLEREIKQLKEVLSSILANSNATKIYFKNTIQFDSQGYIGFYGKTPVKQQSVASDTLANLYTALRAYGLIQ